MLSVTDHNATTHISNCRPRHIAEERHHRLPSELGLLDLESFFLDMRDLLHCGTLPPRHFLMSRFFNSFVTNVDKEVIIMFILFFGVHFVFGVVCVFVDEERGKKGWWWRWCKRGEHMEEENRTRGDKRRIR